MRFLIVRRILYNREGFEYSLVLFSGQLVTSHGAGHGERVFVWLHNAERNRCVLRRMPERCCCRFSADLSSFCLTFSPINLYHSRSLHFIIPGPICSQHSNDNLTIRGNCLSSRTVPRTSVHSRTDCHVYFDIVMPTS